MATDDMPTIPQPEVLDATRVDRDDREDVTVEDHRTRAALVRTALDQTCDYATQLWQTSSALRGYLHTHTPKDDDDAAWTQWQDAYAAVTSVLCGPHGDSGLGREQATLITEHRRRS